MRALALAARRTNEALAIPRRRREIQPAGHSLQGQPLRRGEAIARHLASAEPPLRPEPKRGLSLLAGEVIEPEPAAEAIHDASSVIAWPSRGSSWTRGALRIQDRPLRRRNAGAKANRARPRHRS